MEAVKASGIVGRVSMIEEVEERWLPQCGLFSYESLRSPAVKASRVVANMLSCRLALG